jgi:Transposase DDE domain group 1
MIKQTVLPFKVEATMEMITAHAGLALLGEFAAGLGLNKALNGCLPAPGSGVGYLASEHVFPLILMLNGGGRTLEDIREIRDDVGLREVLQMKRMPSADATGDWLRRSGKNGGLEGLDKVRRRVLKRTFKHEKGKSYTLDIDATGIEAEKESAKMTYKGYTGYMPMVGHLAENGLIVGDEFREGNDSPGARNLDFLKYCERQMPQGKKIKAFRADSASYQAGVINHCQGNGIKFAIGGDLDAAVKDVIKGMAEGEWRSYQNGLIGETVHCMNETKEAFRLVVIRRPYQGNLFDEEKSESKYTVIATNREDSAEEVVQWYNQRGQCSENRIKELKIGFGMERMPCGQFEANAVFFRIGVLAYNVGRLFVLSTLDKSWHRHQVQTLRWKLYETAGKVVNHGRYIYLKIGLTLRDLFDKVRLRSWEFAQT